MKRCLFFVILWAWLVLPSGAQLVKESEIVFWQKELAKPGKLMDLVSIIHDRDTPPWPVIPGPEKFRSLPAEERKLEPAAVKLLLTLRERILLESRSTEFSNTFYPILFLSRMLDRADGMRNMVMAEALRHAAIASSTEAFWGDIQPGMSYATGSPVNLTSELTIPAPDLRQLWLRMVGEDRKITQHLDVISGMAPTIPLADALALVGYKGAVPDRPLVEKLRRPCPRELAISWAFSRRQFDVVVPKWIAVQDLSSTDGQLREKIGPSFDAREREEVVRLHRMQIDGDVKRAYIKTVMETGMPPSPPVP